MQDTSVRSTRFLSFASRDEWLAARQTMGIGSSEVPAILGLSKYESPLSLYYLKTGQIEKPTARYAEMARWGQILEPVIAQRYTEVTGRTLAEAQPFTIQFNPAMPHMTASVDRFVNGFMPGEPEDGQTFHPPRALPTVLELKNVHFVVREQWNEDHNNEPPVEYQIQVQHQLAVTGLEHGSIAALIGGSEFKWADIRRDDALIDSIKAACAEFWRRVELRDPPKADELEATKDVLTKIYPKDNGSTTNLPAEAFEWHGELAAAKEARKALETEIARYENLLKQAIGENTMGLLIDGSAYSLKHQARKGYTVEPCEFRTLRFHKSRGN